MRGEENICVNYQRYILPHPFSLHVKMSLFKLNQRLRCLDHHPLLMYWHQVCMYTMDKVKDLVGQVFNCMSCYIICNQRIDLRVSFHQVIVIMDSTTTIVLHYICSIQLCSQHAITGQALTKCIVCESYDSKIVNHHKVTSAV